MRTHAVENPPSSNMGTSLCPGQVRPLNNVKAYGVPE